MNFREFIHSAPRIRRPTDAVEDFILDAQQDRKFPADFESWNDLRSYLRGRGACDGCIQAAKKVWRIYKTSIHA